MNYSTCKYVQFLDNEKERGKSKKDTPMQVLVAQQFSLDQGKTKKAELAWFDKLEDELDSMETDERLMTFFTKAGEEE